jgi:hypothetical protein
LDGTVNMNAFGITQGTTTSATASSQLLAMAVTIEGAPPTYASISEWS